MNDDREMATILANEIAIYNSRVNAFNSNPLYYGGDLREKKFNQMRDKLILRVRHHFANFDENLVSKIKSGSMFTKDIVHGNTDRELIADELLGVDQDSLFVKDINEQN